jgi:hypothetical protein
MNKIGSIIELNNHEIMKQQVSIENIHLQNECMEEIIIVRKLNQTK